MNKKNFLNFEDAKQYVKTLNLKTWSEYIEYCKSNKRPANIPVHPEREYKKTGWINMYDFIGITKEESIEYVKSKGRKKRGNDDIFHWKSYEEAENYAKSLCFKSNKEWRKFCKTSNKPVDIPASPDKAYKDKGWISWSQFLGNKNNNFTKQFLPFENAHELIVSLKLKFEGSLWDGWNEYCKSGLKPDNIPSNPDKIYKEYGWKSMAHWLTGEDKVVVEYCSYEECKAFVKKLGFSSQKQWREYCKSGLKPDYIPTDPVSVYGKRR